MNSKNAQQLHNRPPVGDPANSARKSKIGKADVRHWLKRVEKPAPREGYVSPFYSVQIAFRGQRVRFPLETANKEAAADKARSIYLSLLTNGWEATLAQYKPKSVKSDKPATIGELLTEVGATSGLRPSTFSIYGQALRFIASEIKGIGDQPALDADGKPIKDKKGRTVLKSRFDHKAGGRNAWVAKVDALPLDIFTPDSIQRWKLAYLEKSGAAPDARRRASNSVNSHLRNARSLFGEKALKHARNTLRLPDPLPFAGVKLEKRGNTRYTSRIDANQLVRDAQKELAGTERFKIFCLGLLCGLRKREIDSLLWRQVVFTGRQIRIEPTEYFQPKSEESIGVVDLEKPLLALLRGWKAQATGEFVITSKNPPRYQKSRTNYRCESDFNALYAWLRGKGITARKPLHELRKELGAILASKQGIFAAMSVLRHAQISTTAAYYADKKHRITAGLGHLLKASKGTIPFPSKTAKKAAKPPKTSRPRRASA